MILESNFIEVQLTYNKLHAFKVYNLIHFNKCMPLPQESEQTHHPPKLPNF